jgi:hypothetical protein
MVAYGGESPTHKANDRRHVAHANVPNPAKQANSIASEIHHAFS